MSRAAPSPMSWPGSPPPSTAGGRRSPRGASMGTSDENHVGRRGYGAFMQSNGVESRGHVLLIGGADVVHRRRLRWSPTAALAALAGVPAAVLAGDDGQLPV